MILAALVGTAVVGFATICPTKAAAAVELVDPAGVAEPSDPDLHFRSMLLPSEVYWRDNALDTVTRSETKNGGQNPTTWQDYADLSSSNTSATAPGANEGFVWGVRQVSSWTFTGFEWNQSNVWRLIGTAQTYSPYQPTAWGKTNLSGSGDGSTSGIGSEYQAGTVTTYNAPQPEGIMEARVDVEYLVVGVPNGDNTWDVYELNAGVSRGGTSGVVGSVNKRTAQTWSQVHPGSQTYYRVNDGGTVSNAVAASGTNYTAASGTYDVDKLLLTLRGEARISQAEAEALVAAAEGITTDTILGSVDTTGTVDDSPTIPRPSFEGTGSIVPTSGVWDFPDPDAMVDGLWVMLANSADFMLDLFWFLDYLPDYSE